MITLAIFILFVAFYALYYTSKKATLTYNHSIEKWMKNHPSQTKFFGVSLLIIAYLIWVATTAFGVGSLVFSIALMTIGSLIVILKPLEYITFKNIFLLFILIGIIEFYYS
ncbi:hypothetical protein [Flavobacterium adhaerens]|uniref:hypothetical protein n=1 Tax=Flavobacterium adhaerens TaxID=3149043 RepID=UPI0032B33223